MSSRSNYRGSTLSNNPRQDMNRSRSSHRNSNEYKSQKRTTSYDRSYSSRNNRRTFEENNRKKYGDIEDEYVDCKAILDNEKNSKFRSDSKYNRNTSNKGNFF